MSDPLFLLPTASLVDDDIVLDGPEGRHAATVRRIAVGGAWSCPTAPDREPGAASSVLVTMRCASG